MAAIDLAKLAKIPYLDVPNIGGRFLSALTFFDAQTWRMWVQAGDELFEVKAWPAEAFYYASRPESTTDLSFHFLDFIAQRASFPEAQKAISGLRDDVFNLSASLAKVSHLHKTRESLSRGESRMIATEVEYLFATCKSMFDLLQELICAIWNTVKLLDVAIQKKPLKETFSKIILYQGRASTAEELTERFGLPPPLAAYYVRQSDFFLSLREFRDNIIHRGSQVPTIFSGESDFLVQESTRPFSAFGVWRDDERSENSLVPLMPALGVVVQRTLAACNDFTTTVEQTIAFPSPIVPNMKLFMRGYFNELFQQVLNDANERQPIKVGLS
ncbi:MAG: hypothetical protein AB3X44_07710 [Leptothrix sp. (in: b-proteobacteria)]